MPTALPLNDGALRKVFINGIAYLIQFGVPMLIVVSTSG